MLWTPAIIPAAQGSPASAKTNAVAKSAVGAVSKPARGADAASMVATQQAATAPFSPFRFTAGNGPVRIKADTLSVDYKARSVLFSGKVQATQSGATLTSQTLRVFYADKFTGIDRIVAEGDVRVRQGGRWATGERAVLDEIHHTLEMTGQPVLHDGPNQVAGNRIIVYLDSQKSVVEGANAVIFPRAADQQQVSTP
ncbi:MAG TPA: LptA/OstA family protein [Candidatus Binataceae bacterium]|nr:LptA/OstA family protein [Candidatus Binataceae bacterium]